MHLDKKEKLCALGQRGKAICTIQHAHCQLTLIPFITVICGVPQHKMLRQFLGQVGFASATGATQDDTPVLKQQGHVALDDGLGDHRLKCQGVHTLLTSA